MPNLQNMNQQGLSDSFLELKQFYNVLDYVMEIDARATAYVNLHTSKEFSVFDYLKDNELTLSRIIADLLKPDGKHGQGEVFLRLFLQSVNFSIEDLSGCTVSCEYPMLHLDHSIRRMDIYVSFPSVKAGLAIENKPWADEGHKQIGDYDKEMLARHENRFKIVFLSNDGRDPESIDPSIAQNLKEQNRLVTISYADGFRQWLEECFRRCESANVRWFLRDFGRYIRKSIRHVAEQEEIMELNDNSDGIITSYLTENPERLRQSVRLAATFERLREKIVKEFVLALKERLGCDWTFDNKITDGRTINQYFWIWREHWPGLFVGVESTEYNLRNFLYGVFVKEAPQVLCVQIKDKLDQLVSVGRGNSNWPWYRAVDPEHANWYDETLPKLVFEREDVLDYYAGVMKNLANVVDHVVSRESSESEG